MKGRTYTHASGWRIIHCGHQTANWPYYLMPPDRSVRCVVSWNGRGFASLKAAHAVVSGLAGGTHHYTTEDCTPGVGRVLGVTAYGEALPWLEPERARRWGDTTDRRAA